MKRKILFCATLLFFFICSTYAQNPYLQPVASEVFAGKVALQESTNRDKFEVRVRSLSRGMYILKVFNAYDISVATEKIIVN